MPSIYKTPEGEAVLMTLYDSALDGLGLTTGSRTVPTSLGDTHLLVVGPEEALPLVLLGGGNFLSPSCLAWFLPLAARYRIVAPDLIGQPGRSAPTRPPPQGDGHAQWLLDVLDGMNLARPAFVGMSYGAGLVLRLAGYAAERVASAALVSPAAIVRGSLTRMLLQVAAPMLAYQVRPSPERLRRAVCPVLTEPDEELTAQIGAVYRHVRLDRHLPRLATAAELARFTTPTLVIGAEDDIFFPGDRVVARAQEIVPNLMAAEVLPGSRHIPSREGFRFVNETILQFLERFVAP